MPTLPATAADYFRQPDADRVLVLEIARRTVPVQTYYLSDAPYATERGDIPEDVVFTPIIGGQGLPELRRTLSDPFAGSAATSFGTVTLVGNAQPPMVLKRGAAVTAKIAAPRKLYPYNQAVTLAVGQIARVGGNSEGQITVEITDGTDLIRRATVEVSDTEPLTYGRVRNMEARLFNPATLTYSVHAGQINAVLAVYSDGVALTPATQYTVDLVNGRFTLLQSPVGKITADVEGAVVGGIWLSTTAQIAAELIRRADITLTQTYTVNDGIIGLHLPATTGLSELLTDLMRGAGAYWLIERDGGFTAAEFPMPVGGIVYNERTLLSPISFRAEEKLHESLRFSYQRNWTKYQPRPGASAAMAAFAQVDALIGTVTATGIDTEQVYNENTELETYFDSLGAAQNVALRLLATYSVQRKRVQCDVSYSDTLRLGSQVTLYADGVGYSGAVIALADVFSGAYPIQRIEVLA